MLSPRALSDRRVAGLATISSSAAATAAESDEVGRDDLLLVSRTSDMLGYSAKLSTLRSRPADADPARGATRGDEVCMMIPDTERLDVSRLNGGMVSVPSVRLSLRRADACSHALHTEFNEINRIYIANPLKGSGIRWLHLKLFNAIQV